MSSANQRQDLPNRYVRYLTSIYSRDQEGRSTSFSLHLRTFMLELATWSIAISHLYCVAKIILFVCLNFQFLLNEQNAEATNQSERTSNLQYQLGVAQVSMKCNWVSIVQFLGSGCVSKIKRKERTKRNREFSEKVIERSVCWGWKRVFGGKQCEKDVEVFSSFL